MANKQSKGTVVPKTKQPKQKPVQSIVKAKPKEVFIRASEFKPLQTDVQNLKMLNNKVNKLTAALGESKREHEKNEVKNIMHTSENLNNEEKWGRDHKKYSSIANKMHGKCHFDPFNHIEITPIRTDVNGGVVSVRFETEMKADAAGELHVVIGEEVHCINGEITPGAPFPYSNSSSAADKFVSFVCRSNGGSTDSNLMGNLVSYIDGDQLVDPFKVVMEDIRAFASNMRLLGIGVQLIPTGKLETRTGQLWACTTPKGGFRVVDPQAIFAITKEKVQNNPTFSVGSVVSDYVYATLFPPDIEAIEYKTADRELIQDFEENLSASIGSIYVGVSNGFPADTYAVRFVAHYQLDPARSIFQLLDPVATPANSQTIDEIFSWCMTQKMVHMFPNDGKYNDYVVAVPSKYEVGSGKSYGTCGSDGSTLEGSTCMHFVSCKGGTLSGTMCVHENDAHSHYAELIKTHAAGIIMSQIHAEQPHFKSKSLMASKGVLSDIEHVVKIGTDIANPLLDIIDVASKIF